MLNRKQATERRQLSFNRFLKSVADNITAEELDDLKGLFRGIIGKRQLEKVTSRSFLETLVEHGYVSQKNFIILQCLLLDIDRDDLVEKVVCYSQSHPGIVHFKLGIDGDEVVYVQAKGMSVSQSEAVELMRRTKAWIGEDRQISIALDDETNCNLLEAGSDLFNDAMPEEAPFTCFAQCPNRQRFAVEQTRSSCLETRLCHVENLYLELKEKQSRLEKQLEEEKDLNELMFRDYDEMRSEADRLKIVYELELAKNTNEHMMRRVEDFIRFLTTKINRVFDSNVHNKKRFNFMTHNPLIYRKFTVTDFKGVMKQHEDIDRFLRCKMSRVCNMYGH